MAQTIDSRVVEMRFDNQQFESGVSKTLSTLDKLKQALNFKGRKTGLEDLGKISGDLNLDKVDKAADRINSKFSMMGTIADQVLRRMTDSVINFSHNLLKNVTIAPLTSGFSEYEEKMGSIQTIMMGTGESLEKVSKYLDELNTYSDKTIYSFKDMTSNIGKFTNAGVKLGTAVKAIQGIANEAALSGANTQQASHAMYNFAQALSSGYVKLIDWKSIENSMMATQEFKNVLIQTATALGTLNKQGDKYVSTTINAQGKTSSAFNAMTGFNDSLNNAWMTTDVLTEALQVYSTNVNELTDAQKKQYEEQLKQKGFTEEQIKFFEDVGKKAFEAATKVRTFSQLVDTLKEALGSGWAKTWELVFGDFNEATELWSSINNVLSKLIDSSSDARNNILQLWHDADIGGRTEMIRALREAFYNFLMILSPIRKAFSDTFGAFNVLTLQNFTRGFYNLVESLGITNESSLAIYDIFTKIFTLVKTFGKVIGIVFGGLGKLFVPTLDVLDAMFNAVHRLLMVLTGSNTADELNRKISILAKGLKALYYGVMDKIALGLRIIAALIRTIPFHDLLSKIKGIALAFKDWLEGFKPINAVFKAFDGATKNAIGPLQKIFAILKLLVGKVVDVIKAFKNLHAVRSLVNTVGKGVETAILLIITAVIKLKDIAVNAITFIVNAIRNFDISSLNAPINKINIILKTFGNLFMKVITVLVNKVKNIKSVGDVFKVLFDIIKEGGKTVLDFFSKVFSSDDEEKGNGIKTAFDNIVIGIKEFVSSITPAKVAAVAMAIMFTTLLVNITKLATYMSNAVSNIATLTSNMNGFLLALKSKYTKTKNTFLQFAEGIALIAGSIALLSNIPKDKVLQSVGLLGAITAALVILNGVAAGCSILEKKFGAAEGINRVSVQILALAGSMVIIAGALKIMSAVDLDKDTPKKLLVLMGCITVIGAIATVTTRFGGAGSIGGALTIFAFALSLGKIVDAMSKLAEIRNTAIIEENLKSLLKIIAVLGIVSIAMGKVGLGSSIGLLAVLFAIEKVLPRLQGISKYKPMLSKMANFLDEYCNIVGLIGVTALAMIAVVGHFGSGFMKFSIGIGALTIAMLGLIKLVDIAGDLDPGKAKKGLKTVGIITLLIGGLAVVSGFTEKAHFGSFAVGMLAVTGAMYLMGGLVVILGSLDLGSIKRGTKALSAITAMIGTLMIVTGIVKPGVISMATILGIIAGLTVMGAELMVLSSLSWEQIAKGITALGGVCLMLSIVLQRLSSIGKGATIKQIGETIVIFGGVILSIITITSSLKTLSSIPWDNLLAAAGSLALVFDSLAVAVGIMGKFADFKGVLVGVVGGVVLLGTVTFALMKLTGNGIDYKALLTAADSLGTVFMSLGITMAIMSLIPVAGVAGIAIGVLGALGTIALVVGVASAIASSQELTSLVNGGLKVLGDIGTGLGTAVGNFIGGIGKGISDQLPAIGANLSDFASNIHGFITTFSAEGMENLGANVQSLALAIGILGAAEITNALGNFAHSVVGLLTGDKTSFADSLVNLGKGIKGFADQVTGIDASSLSSVSEASKTIMECVSMIPASGGVADFLFGSKDLSGFGNSLGSLASGIKSFITNASGIGADAIQSAENVIKITDKLVTLSQSIENSGGAISSITGDNDLGTFGESLTSFASSLQTFAGYTASFGGDSFDLVSTGVDNLITITEKMQDLSSIMPNIGGVISFFTGKNDLASFGNNISSYIKSLKVAATEAQGIGDASSFDMVGIITDKLVSISNSLGAMGGGGTASSFATSLINVAKNGLRSFADAFKNDTTCVAAAGVLARKIVEEIAKNYNNFNSVGRNLGIQLSNGFSSGSAGMAQAAQSVVNGMVSSLNAGKQAIYNAGAALGDAAIQGAKGPKGVDDPWPISDKAYNVFTTVTNGASKALTEAAPIVKNLSAKVGNAGATGFLGSIGDAAKKVAPSVGDIEARWKELWGGGAEEAKGGSDSISNSVDGLTNSLDENTASTKKNSKAKGDNSKATSANAKATEEALKAQRTNIKYLDYANQVVRTYASGYGGLLSAISNTRPLDGASEAVKKLAEEIYKASLTGEDSAEDLANHQQKVEEAFVAEYEKIKKSVKDSMDLFKEFNYGYDDIVKPEDLMKNANSQLKGVTEWTRNMMLAAARGVDPDILKSFSDSGVSSMSKLNSVLKLNGEQLQKFNEDYSKSTESLSIFTTNMIMSSRAFAPYAQEVRKTAKEQDDLDKSAKDLFKTYDDQMKKGNLDAATETYNKIEEIAKKQGMAFTDLRTKIEDCGKTIEQQTIKMIDEYTKNSTLLDDYRHKVDETTKSVEESIKSTFLTLDEVKLKEDDDDPLNSDEILEHVKNNLENMKTYYSDFNDFIADYNPSQTMIDYIQKMGVQEGYKYLQAFKNGDEETIKEIINTFNDIESEAPQIAQTTGKTVGDSFLAGFGASFEDLTEEQQKLAGSLTGIVPQIVEKFGAAGKEAAEGMRESLMSMLQPVKETASQVGTEADAALGEHMNAENGYSKAANFMQGILNGLNDYKDDVMDAIEAIDEEVGDAPAEDWDEHSPSKLTYKYGRYFMQGMINGFAYEKDRVIGSVSSVGTSVVDIMQNALQQTDDYLNNGIQSDLTITPVLDLSNVQNGVKTLGSMTDINGFSINPNLGRISTNASNLAELNDILKTKAIGPEANNFNFTQNNYSPKALSRVEIYRQTRSQIAQVKGMVNANA